MNENQTQNEALIAAIKKLMGSTSPEDVKVLNSINNMLSVTAMFAALRSAESSIKDSTESVAESEGAESNTKPVAKECPSVITPALSTRYNHHALKMRTVTGKVEKAKEMLEREQDILDKRQAVIDALQAPLNPDPVRSYFLNHDFATNVAWLEYDDDRWSTVPDHITRTMYHEIFRTSEVYLYINGARHASFPYTCGEATLASLHALRAQLSFADVKNGSRLLNGDMYKTVQFMLLMDEFIGVVDDTLRIPRYHESLKQVLPENKLAVIYDACGNRHCKSSYIHDFLALVNTDFGRLMQHYDGSVGCRSKSVENGN